MRLGWSITAFPRAEAITIAKLPRPRAPLWPTPWSIRVNHVVEISVYTLADDVIKSVPGYMRALKARQDLRDNFRACMDEFFQA